MWVLDLVENLSQLILFSEWSHRDVLEVYIYLERMNRLRNCSMMVEQHCEPMWGHRHDCKMRTVSTQCLFSIILIIPSGVGPSRNWIGLNWGLSFTSCRAERDRGAMALWG